METPALNPEQLDEKRDYERLFGEAAWHRLEKIWEERIKTIRLQGHDSIRTMEELWYQRGIIAVLEEMTRLRADQLASYDPPKEYDVGDASGY